MIIVIVIIIIFILIVTCVELPRQTFGNALHVARWIDERLRSAAHNERRLLVHIA